MTNENQQMNTTTEQKTAAFGSRLKSAREALGLERKDAAAQLRLNENLIVMMEKDKYPDNLPVTFIRGYIRAYGKLLQIPELEIRQAIEPLTTNPTAVQQPVTTIKPTLFEPVTSSNYFMQFFTYLIGLTIIGLAGIWWYTRTPAPTQTLPTVAVEKPAAPPAAAPTMPAPMVNPNMAQPGPIETLPPTMANPGPEQIRGGMQIGQVPPSAANHPLEGEPAVTNEPSLNPETKMAAPAPLHQDQTAQLYANPQANPAPQQAPTVAAPTNQAPVVPTNPAPQQQVVQPQASAPLNPAVQGANPTAAPTQTVPQQSAGNTNRQAAPAQASARPQYLNSEIEVLPEPGEDYY